MDLSLRPMSTSQVLDRTFYLYRNNFVLFAGIAMVAPALSLIAGLVQLGIFGPPVTPQLESSDATAFYDFVMGTMVRTAIQLLISLIVYAVGTALAASATVYAVSMVHLGKSTTIGESYAKIKPIFWKILRVVLAVLLIALSPLIITEALSAGILVAQLRWGLAGGGQPGLALLLLLGLLLLLLAVFCSVIWLVYAFCRYALAVPVCTLEKLPVKQALIRSRFLIKNSLGRIFGVYVLTLIMSLVLTAVLQLPAYITGNVFTMKPGMHMSAFTLSWLFLGEFLGKTMAGPIVTIAIALLYYDQRVRKEAFDLQLMMEAVDQQAQPQAAGAAPPL